MFDSRRDGLCPIFFHVWQMPQEKQSTDVDSRPISEDSLFSQSAAQLCFVLQVFHQKLEFSLSGTESRKEYIVAVLILGSQHKVQSVIKNLQLWPKESGYVPFRQCSFSYKSLICKLNIKAWACRSGNQGLTFPLCPSFPHASLPNPQGSQGNVPRQTYVHFPMNIYGKPKQIPYHPYTSLRRFISAGKLQYCLNIPESTLPCTKKSLCFP